MEGALVMDLFHESGYGSAETCSDHVDEESDDYKNGNILFESKNDDDTVDKDAAIEETGLPPKMHQSSELRLSTDLRNEFGTNDRDSEGRNERMSEKKRIKLSSSRSGVVNCSSENATCVENSSSESTTGVEKRSSESTSSSHAKRHIFHRTVPHIRGNWAGLIYAPLELESTLNGIAFLKAAQRRVQLFRNVLDRVAGTRNDKDGELHVISHIGREVGYLQSTCTDNRPSRSIATPLHLSLSRQFYLQRPSIPQFERDLRRRLAFHQRLTITLDPKRSEILVNDQGTRSFLTIPAVAGVPAVQNLIRVVDGVLEKYGQPTYYQIPKVHVSVASAKGDVRMLVGSLIDDYEKQNEEDDIKITVLVDRVECSLGSGSAPKKTSFGLTT